MQNMSAQSDMFALGESIFKTWKKETDLEESVSSRLKILVE